MTASWFWPQIHLKQSSSSNHMRFESDGMGHALREYIGTGRSNAFGAYELPSPMQMLV